jgi:hypothetical protein
MGHVFLRGVGTAQLTSSGFLQCSPVLSGMFKVWGSKGLGAYAPCRDNKIGLSAQAVDAVASPIAGCRAMRLFDLRFYPAAAAAVAVAVAQE